MLAGLSKMIKSLLLIFILSQTILAQSDSTKYKIYKWTGKNAETKIQVFEIELKIPKDYEQDHWYYGEGVVTTLQFSDSSILTLHCGFTMKIPLLDEPEYSVNFMSDLEDYILRRGINKKTKLFWEEHNYKGKPINLAISNIPKDKITLYQNVLKSIKISKNK